MAYKIDLPRTFVKRTLSGETLLTGERNHTTLYCMKKPVTCLSAMKEAFTLFLSETI